MTIIQRLCAVFFVSTLLLPVNSLGVWPERRSLNALFDEASNILPSLVDITPSALRRQINDSAQLSTTDKTSDTSNALWILEDEYAAPNFFEYVLCSCILATPINSVNSNFTFYTGPDPTK